MDATTVVVTERVEKLHPKMY